MTEVLLINPPRQKNGKLSLFNNSLLWLSSFLIEKGISCKCIFLKENFETDLINQLNIHKPKFVGISLKWWDTIYGAIVIANLVKSVNKEIHVFCGGQTATVFSKEILQETIFDSVIEGDAEIPLYSLIKGEDLQNIYLKQNGNIKQFPRKYIQNDNSISNLKLHSNLSEIFDDWNLITNYIWTGKGCAMDCFFCAGGRTGQNLIFKRKGYIYRDIESTLYDIKVTTKIKNNLFMMDFDPLVSKKNSFYLELFSKLPDKEYSCEFYFWTLPSFEFLKFIQEKFKYLVFEFDLQIFSEKLRYRLAKLNYIKPIFFKNKDFEEVLDFCYKSKNIAVNVAGLIGVPYETPDDINEIYNYSNFLINKYHNISNITFSPIIIEPASPIIENSKKYDVTCLRKTYKDFYNYTKKVFENNLLNKNINNFEEYLDYTGIIRNNYDERIIFNECFSIQEKITESVNKRIYN